LIRRCAIRKISIDVDLATLFNISNPRLLIAAAVLLALLHWEFLPPWLGIVGFFAWVLKDVMLYPLLHRAYQTNAKTGLQALVGARGFAHDDLSRRVSSESKVSSGARERFPPLR